MAEGYPPSVGVGFPQNERQVAKEKDFMPPVFEEVKDENPMVVGGIEDINVSSGDKKVSLGQFLPKGWGFERGSFVAHLRDWGGIVSYERDQLGSWFGQLSLLHEIGHARRGLMESELERKVYWEEILLAPNWLTRFQIRVLASEGKSVTDYSVEEGVEIVKEALGKNPEHQKDLFDGLISVLQEERDAWAEALKITRGLKRGGADILGGVRTIDLDINIHGGEGLGSYWDKFKYVLERRYGIDYQAFLDYYKENKGRVVSGGRAKRG